MFIAHYVEDAAVLDVGAGTDADVVDVAADDRAGPDAGVGADDYVADDYGGGGNVSGGGDFWALAAVGADVGLSNQCGAACVGQGLGLVNHNALPPPRFCVSVDSNRV